jgi:uncharacterized membrane protein
MTTIQESIDVAVPVTAAYNQWTQFEQFPQFMEGVKDVRQLDDTHLHWVVEVAGKEKQWQAAITRQQPDELIAWQATDGTPNAGEVSFEALDAGSTRVSVSMGFEPEGLVETAGAALGVAKRRVLGDLERFRDLVESGPAEPGWRGDVGGEDAGRPPAGF